LCGHAPLAPCAPHVKRAVGFGGLVTVEFFGRGRLGFGRRRRCGGRKALRLGCVLIRVELDVHLRGAPAARQRNEGEARRVRRKAGPAGLAAKAEQGAAVNMPVW